ncbi:hypothetical protein GGI17_000979 [Coemansia sp. S146]|nr:hypothetical protein GGI17_000979 [Coemansia sp. S146]
MAETKQVTLLSIAEMAHVTSMLTLYVPKEKGQLGMGIEAWLKATQVNLSDLNVPKVQWVVTAKTKMPIGDRSDYNQWSVDKNSRKQTWSNFSKLTMKHFIGAILEIDAYCRLKHVHLPTSEKDLDAMFTEIETLCELTSFKPVDELKAVQFVSMMPADFMMQAFGHEGSSCNMKIGKIKTLLRTHYQAKKLAASNNNHCRGPPHPSLPYP